MATFKAVVGPKRSTDGMHNIKIRVTHERQVRRISTGWYVSSADLNRKGEIKNTMYIDLVEDLIRKYRDRCAVFGPAMKFLTVDEVVRIATREDEDQAFRLDIVEYTRNYARQLRNDGHGGTASVYECAVSSLVRYAGREIIDVSELTVKFLNGWISWIQRQPAPHGKRGSRAPSLYLAQIRAMHNRAKKEFNEEEAGVIKIAGSPFSKIDIPKPELPRKRALTADEIRRIAELPYRNDPHHGNDRFNLAKDVFLLSFALVGMNAADLYGCTSYAGGRITYQRQKTRTRRADRAEISIKVEKEFKELVAKYRSRSGERVFSFSSMYSSVNTFSAALNKGLKEVGRAAGIEGLQFYAARHSWATIALNDVGIDKYTVHTALNHVDDSMKITDVYIRKSWEPIDRANRQVLDFIGIKPDFTENRSGNVRDIPFGSIGAASRKAAK